MQSINPAAILDIKLGEGGRWADASIKAPANGLLKLAELLLR